MSVFAQLRERCLDYRVGTEVAALTKEAIAEAFNAMLARLPQLKVERVAVAVSGGPDSLALLAAAVQHFGNGNVVALSIDHQLPDVNEHPSLVAQMIAPLQVQHVGIPIQWPDDAVPATAKLQLQMREQRYRLLGEACQQRGIPLLLLGHHRDDDLATMCYRMGKSSGLDGLAGMKPIAPLPVMHPMAGRLSAQGTPTGVFVGRPFLHVPKSQLVATCQHMLGTARFDPSNSSPSFQRNVIIAALKHAGLEMDRFAHLLDTFKHLRAFMNAHVSALMRSAVILDRNNGCSTLVLNSPALLAPENKPALMRTVNVLLQFSAAVHRPMKLPRLNELYQQMHDAFQAHLAEEAARRRKLPRSFANQPPLPIDQTRRLKAAAYSLGGGIVYPLSRMHSLKRVAVHNQRMPARPLQFGPGFLIQSARDPGAACSLSDITTAVPGGDYIVFDKRVYLRPTHPLDTATCKWSVEPLELDRIKMYEVCARLDRVARAPLQALLAAVPMTHTYPLPIIIAEDRTSAEILYMAIPTIDAYWLSKKATTIDAKLRWEYVHSGECILSSRFLCLP